MVNPLLPFGIPGKPAFCNCKKDKH